MRIPKNRKELEKMGEPQFDLSFMNSDSLTKEELYHYYWFSVAKPSIEKLGWFNKLEFDGVLSQEKAKYTDSIDGISLGGIYEALKEAKEICFIRWGLEQAPKTYETNYVLQDIIGW